MKKCSRCQQEKSESEFYEVSKLYGVKRPGKLRSRCKKCHYDPRIRKLGKDRDEKLKTGRDYVKKNNLKNKRAAYEAYGGFKYVCCGETTEVFLTLDHVNNDGAEHRKKVKPSYLYRWLKQNNYPPGLLQVLCYNCNNAKHLLGYCPHQRGETVVY